MDAWLEKIREPSQVERLLEAFAVRSGLLPEGVCRVRDPQALPGSLQHALADPAHHTWVCFSHSRRFWLFTGILMLGFSHARKTPVLLVNSYDTEGLLVEVGIWSAERDGQWRRWDDDDEVSNAQSVPE